MLRPRVHLADVFLFGNTPGSDLYTRAMGLLIGWSSQVLSQITLFGLGRDLFKMRALRNSGIVLVVDTCPAKDKT